MNQLYKLPSTPGQRRHRKRLRRDAEANKPQGRPLVKIRRQCFSISNDDTETKCYDDKLFWCSAICPWS